MVRLMRWVLVPAVLGWLVGATPVVAQNRSAFIQDEAGFFSKEAIAKANAEIGEIKSRFKKELVVDTVVTVKRPADLDKTDTQAVNRFFDSWAEQRAGRERVNGVFVVIVGNPHKVRVFEENKTEQTGLFRADDRRELEKLVIADMTAADKEGMKNQEKNDKVLADAVKFVHQRMEQHASQAAQNRQAAPVHHGQAGGGGVPWLKYLLIGIGIFLVLWIVFGIIRGLSGGARGGYGGGYGGAPGMAGGGGGGGFFSSLLGGMFGAAAGMWMYNNFFGGHSNSAWGAGPDASGGAGGDNDAGGAYSGGGGDYGDQGGGDAGGGDWGGGGGGDAGGGDAGGGGGDWGGGGGGDFGGGGGGDWGGGGGGGGGDW